jgi:hypothetical protein
MSRLFLLINIETHLIRALDRLRLPCVVAPPTLILMTPGRWITDAACEGEGMDRCARGSIWDRDPAPVKKCHRVIPKDVLAQHHDVCGSACPYIRSRIELPGNQSALVAALRAAAAPQAPLIGLLIHGGALALGPAAAHLDAVVDAWCHPLGVHVE